MRHLHTENPVIYHFPVLRFKCFPDKKNSGNLCFINRSSFYMEYFKQVLFKDQSKRGSLRKPKDLDVLLVKNTPSKTVLEKSMDYLGISGYVVLFKNQKKWDFQLKISMALDYLKTSTLPYVLFMDAFDVLVFDDLHKVLEHFLHSGTDILFNADTVSYPVNPEAERFENERYRQPFTHLNSGVYIGKRSSLIPFLEECLQKFPEKERGGGDQEVIREVQMRWYPRVKIDDQRRVFSLIFGPVCPKELISGELPKDFFLKLWIWEKKPFYFFVFDVFFHRSKKFSENGSG